MNQTLYNGPRDNETQTGPEPKKERHKRPIVGVLFLVATTLVIYFFVKGIDVLFSGPQTSSSPIPLQQPSTEPSIDLGKIEEIKNKKKLIWDEYLASKRIGIYPNGLVTPKSLITACEDSVKNQEACNREIANITATIKTRGSIKKSYLYIKAGVSRGNEPLVALTSYDSIWFYITRALGEKVTDKDLFGGHLQRNKAIINRTAEDGSTEVLFDMNSLPVTGLPYSEDSEPRRYDNALAALNEEGKHFIGGFVSTLGFGRILEMEVGYEGGLIEKTEPSQ